MAKKKLDPFHYHEVVDRCYLISDMIEDCLILHPACKNKKDSKKLYKAISLIQEVYQDKAKRY
jgi:hypothetical protein